MSKSGGDTGAFEYESGQFICHLFAKVPENDSSAIDLLNDIIEAVSELETEKSVSEEQRWVPMDKDGFHITLVRGHWAIYQHQIRPLVESIRSQCKRLGSVFVCLDRVKIFDNNERSKQFMCLASRDSQSCQNLGHLKQCLTSAVREFAIRLTDEDETEDTLAHCSLFYRKPVDVKIDEIDTIEEACLKRIGQHPTCLFSVKSIFVKIGCVDYEIAIGNI